MRKLLLVSVIGSMLVPAVAWAGNWGMAGCGLGTLIMSGRGTGAQITAATSNGTMGNQTFGITSGTSNCTQDGAVASTKQRQAFAEASLPSILRDMSTGRGEYVVALGQLYGCKRATMATFTKSAQKNFGQICADNQCTKPGTFLSSFETQMSKDGNVAKSCAGLNKAQVKVASR